MIMMIDYVVSLVAFNSMLFIKHFSSFKSLVSRYNLHDIDTPIVLMTR